MGAQALKVYRVKYKPTLIMNVSETGPCPLSYVNEYSSKRYSVGLELKFALALSTSNPNHQKEHLELNYLFMKPPVVEALLNICNL